jgi:hypothetical protein
LPDKSAKETQRIFHKRVLGFFIKEFSFYLPSGAWESSIGHMKLTLIYVSETSAVKFTGNQIFSHLTYLFAKLAESCPTELATLKSTTDRCVGTPG